VLDLFGDMVTHQVEADAIACPNLKVFSHNSDEGRMISVYRSQNPNAGFCVPQLIEKKIGIPSIVSSA